MNIDAWGVNSGENVGAERSPSPGTWHRPELTEFAAPDLTGNAGGANSDGSPTSTSV